MSETPKRILDGGGDAEIRGARSLLASHDSAPPTGARNRVWGRIAETPSPSSRSWLWFAPVAVAVAVALLFLRPTPTEVAPPPAAPLARAVEVPVQREATIQARGSVEVDGRPLRTIAHLRPGARIDTKTEGEASVSLPDRTRLRFDANTLAALERIEPETLLSLETGRVDIELGSLSETPLTVVAGPWTLTAVGRAFSVERVGDDLVVETKDARARLEGPRHVELESGRSFDSRAIAAAEPTHKSPPPPPRTRTQRELYEEAKKRTGRAAVDLFDRAAEATGPLTELALYQAARLELQNGNSSSALERFEKLARRFPRGALARETGLSVIECKLELGRLTEARAELDAYLAAFPDTERQTDLAFLRAELHRKLGDCERALVDYQQVREGARVEVALYMTAWCADRLGRLEDAKQALDEYLRRFPAGRHAEAARGYLRVGSWSDKKE